jgi:chromosome segregation ATPase
MSLALSNRAKSNLTLKEQNSKIDKLSKENFDLKLKIHFLDQALQNRSDEGVKDMINKNVQLQTDLANEKKESQALRRKVRELERKLKAQEEGQAAKQTDSDDDKSDRSERQAELEEEVIYLRETLQETQIDLEKLREENLAREVDKRKMAEYVKAMGERKVSEPTAGIEEAMEMWKDLLEAETARREQADEDAEKLREELRRLKTETPASTTNSNVRNVYQFNKRHNVSYTTRSDAGSVAGDDMNGTVSSKASTLVDQLKHENAELRRDLSAQTSMLTSRNRERERLQQEIEDLKLNHRRHGDGVRSIAGDSIFERSVSRAHNRAESRASGHTRVTQLSDVERDEYEKKHAGLRDELAQIKMVNQDLERELNAHLDILQNVEAENRALKEDKDLTMEDLQALQTERDDALLALQDRDEELEELRKEAVDEIETLEKELEQKEQDYTALNQEMKTVSERVVRLEDELNASRRREQSLEQQLEDSERELERTDEKLRDTIAKNERLDVQLESSQDEIAFLREEQEGDKIKIGGLEAALSAAQTSLQDEKEGIVEERRQREVLDNQEKVALQKVLDELNAEANKFKDESRKLRKSLGNKEAEASQWKERLETLESNLREALGDLNGTRSSLLKVRSFLSPDLEYIGSDPGE